jgi:hypothetical protein
MWSSPKPRRTLLSAALPGREPQPGIGDDEGGFLDRLRDPLDQGRERRGEHRRLPHRATQRTRSEQIGWRVDLVVLLQLVAAVGTGKPAVAEALGIHRKDVRRHREGLQTEESLNQQR